MKPNQSKWFYVNILNTKLTHRCYQVSTEQLNLRLPNVLLLIELNSELKRIGRQIDVRLNYIANKNFAVFCCRLFKLWLSMYIVQWVRAMSWHFDKLAMWKQCRTNVNPSISKLTSNWNVMIPSVAIFIICHTFGGDKWIHGSYLWLN